MGVVVDTGVFIQWERHGKPFDTQFADLTQPLFISAITASELLVGVHRADSVSRREIRSRFVEAILNRFSILEIDLSIARQHAALQATLIQNGTPIGYQDLWIAATSVALGHAIMTTNEKDFSRISNLKVISIKSP
jgi:tRNA(fMet)-specific endonuclease VapC